MNEAGSPVSLLIVDDNPGDRGLYRQYLLEDTERELLGHSNRQLVNRNQESFAYPHSPVPSPAPLRWQ